MSDKPIAMPVGVPSLASIKDTNTRAAIMALWSIIQTLYGQGKTIEQRAVFVSDLVRLGVLTRIGDNLYSAANVLNLGSLVDAKVAEAVSETAGSTSAIVTARGTLDARTGLATGTHSLNVVLPANAVVVWSMISINRAFDGSAGTTMQIGVEVQDTDIFRADTLLTDAIYQSGSKLSWPDFKTTDARTCSAIVTGGAVTDGYLTLDVQYTVVDAM